MQIKTIQRSITIGLAVLLLLILSGYVYFGMQQAKQGDVVVSQPISTTTPLVTSEQMTHEQKQAILNALSSAADASSTMSVEARQKILNSLQTNSNATETAMTEEARLKILESLQKN